MSTLATRSAHSSASTWNCRLCQVTFTNESIEQHIIVNHQLDTIVHSSGKNQVYNCGDCTESSRHDVDSVDSNNPWFCYGSFEGIARHCLRSGHNPSRVSRGPNYERYSDGLFTALHDILTMPKDVLVGRTVSRLLDISGSTTDLSKYDQHRPRPPLVRQLLSPKYEATTGINLNDENDSIGWCLDQSSTEDRNPGVYTLDGLMNASLPLEDSTALKATNEPSILPTNDYENVVEEEKLTKYQNPLLIDFGDNEAVETMIKKRKKSRQEEETDFSKNKETLAFFSSSPNKKLKREEQGEGEEEFGIELTAAKSIRTKTRLDKIRLSSLSTESKNSPIPLAVAQSAPSSMRITKARKVETSKGRMMIEIDGYLYYYHRSAGRGGEHKAYRCVKFVKGCRKRLTIQEIIPPSTSTNNDETEETDGFFTVKILSESWPTKGLNNNNNPRAEDVLDGGHGHSHGRNPAAFESFQLRRTLRRRARMTNQHADQLVEHALSQVSPVCAASLPSPTSLSRVIRKHRQRQESKALATSPNDIDHLTLDSA